MKTIITLDRANQPFGFPQLNAKGNYNSVIVESGLTSNTLTITGLTESLTDTNVLSIDNNGVVNTYPLSNFTGGTSLSGEYLPLSGGTVTGDTIFESGFTANTISVLDNLKIIDTAGGGETVTILPIAGGISVPGRTQYLPDGNGTYTLKVNNVDAGDDGSLALGLNDITSENGTTNNSIIMNGCDILVGQPGFGGVIELNSNGSSYPARLYSSNITSSAKNIEFPNSDGTLVISVNGYTANTAGQITIPTTSGDYLPLSGGTVTGNTIFSSGLTANTLNVTGNTNVSGRTTTSGLTSTASITFPQKFVTTSYTATTSDYLIDVTAGSNLTITLPDCTTIPGRLYVIKNNFDTQVNVVGTSGQTIDGASFIRLGETNSISVASNGIYWVSIGVSTGTAPIPVSTGVYSFTGITAATSATTFYVSPLKGYIVNDLSPTAPTVTFINYTGGTHSVTNLTTTTETWVYCDVNGVIQQQNTELSEQQRRQNIFLGKLGHANKQYIVNVFNSPDQILSSLSQFRDMFAPIGYINGGVYPSANTGLTMNTSAGFLYGLGINFVLDTLNPDRIIVNSQNPATFQYRTQTGGTASNTTLVDPTNYDVNGVVTPITGTKATNQRVYLLANGQIRIQYGQTLYNQLSAAIAGIATETFNTFSNFSSNGILIGIISILSTATNTVGGGLDDPNKAQIFLVSKFGETVGAAGGVATTTLQQAYNNSSDPEIITDSTRGALVIQRGSASDNDDVFQIQTAAGVHTFAIDGSGKTTTTTLLVTGSTNPVTISNLSNSANTRFIVSNSSGVLTYRTDVLTGSSSISAVTLSSANVLSVTPNGGTGTTTTINAVTGGTYNNTTGTITLSGTGNVNGNTITGFTAGGGTGITWSAVTTSVSAVVNYGFICNSASLITLTLPTGATVGSIIEIVGINTGGWRVAQNAGQTIHFGITDSQTGTGGYIQSTQRYDSVRLLCTTLNTDYTVLSSIGNITII